MRKQPRESDVTVFEKGNPVNMDQPSTSTATDEDQQIGAENIGPTTTKLLNRLIWKLKKDQSSTARSIPLSKPISRTAMYTGMNVTNVEKILTFGDLECEIVEINRQIIQVGLMRMYTEKKHIPTITELFKYLEEELPIYVDYDYFTNILIRMGYAFYKFPGTKALRVMEKKSVTFERCRYLTSIQQYRKNKMSIAYVGLVSLNHRMNVINLERTLQTDTKYISRHILFTASMEGIQNIKVIHAASPEALKNAVKSWLLEIFVLQKLLPGSVCILEDSKIFSDTLTDVPTWKSVKVDMVDWLEEHNIPCNIDMSKADLLQLIETCTDTNENTYVIDNLVKSHNYGILRLPQCINQLSIIALVVRYLNEEQNLTNLLNPLNVSKLLSNLTTAQLKDFVKSVEMKEILLLNEDVKIDNILDELIRNMKTLEIDAEVDEDDIIFTTYSDTE